MLLVNEPVIFRLSGSKMSLEEETIILCIPVRNVFKSPPCNKGEAGFIKGVCVCEAVALRPALHSDRGHLLLVAVSVEAGDIVVYDLDLLPGKAGVFKKDNLVLLAVLGERRGEKWEGEGKCERDPQERTTK